MTKMETTHGLKWLTNKKGHPYEDRYVEPLGDFLNRLDAAATDGEADDWQAQIDARKERGLVYAVMDGVGSAPKGLQAAEATATKLRELYKRQPPMPATYGSIRSLLEEVNLEVEAWGTIAEVRGKEAFGAANSQGAAGVTAAYFSPAGNVTILHVGDTIAFHYRPGDTPQIKRLTTNDGNGYGIRSYIGQGESLAPQVVQLHSMRPGDLLVLVTDGVVPKGMQQDGVLKAVGDNEGNPEAAAEALVTRARARGSIDDITAMVVRLDWWS
jgi:serine/threonine protein phosphatase PrpC